jgi:DNA-binding transcriptional MerR regulator
VDDSWTLSALVAEVERRIAALPAPRNGQVRAIPDERTIRYYGTIGLLDRPSAMRGRTALYGRKHVAQIIAIKRLQSMGRSLAEIQGLWPTLDDHTLARMSGVELPAPSKAPVRAAFWKREAQPSSVTRSEASSTDAPALRGEAPRTDAPASTVELRLELAPGAVLALSVDESAAVTLTPADVRALRAAAAPLLAELASRRLASHSGGEEP